MYPVQPQPPNAMYPVQQQPPNTMYQQPQPPNAMYPVQPQPPNAMYPVQQPSNAMYPQQQPSNTMYPQQLQLYGGNSKGIISKIRLTFEKKNSLKLLFLKKIRCAHLLNSSSQPLYI
jgi:hypothetical protein